MLLSNKKKEREKKKYTKGDWNVFFFIQEHLMDVSHVRFPTEKRKLSASHLFLHMSVCVEFELNINPGRTTTTAKREEDPAVVVLLVLLIYCDDATPSPTHYITSPWMWWRTMALDCVRGEQQRPPSLFSLLWPILCQYFDLFPVFFSLLYLSTSYIQFFPCVQTTLVTFDWLYLSTSRQLPSPLFIIRIKIIKCIALRNMKWSASTAVMLYSWKMQVENEFMVLWHGRLPSLFLVVGHRMWSLRAVGSLNIAGGLNLKIRLQSAGRGWLNLIDEMESFLEIVIIILILWCQAETSRPRKIRCHRLMMMCLSRKTN